MKKGKLILAAVALLALFFIGGTMAYFTDTDTATNTFTLGNVDIELTETNWVASNAEGLLPGATVAKNPAINNVGTSPAYVFLEVVEPCYNNVKTFEYTVDSAWTSISGGTCAANTGISTATTVYAYGTSSAMSTLNASASTTALFPNVTLKSTLDENTIIALRNAATDPQNPVPFEITVNAYGIQSQNLASNAPSSVWANF